MNNNFLRTQIYLEQEQIHLIKSASHKEGVPMSVLIRRAIDQFLNKDKNRKWANDPLSKNVGKISLKSKSASVDHDHYLYGVK